MVRWFRHYPGLVRDEKLVAVALRSAQSIERVIWIWGAILEDAATREEHGAFAIDLPECAYFLRVDPAELARIMAALDRLGRIELTGEGEGLVLAWPRRQFASDSSTERVRDHRARARGNVSETAAQRFRNAAETEAEAKTETDSTTTKARARARAS